ncbi:putative disease resistance protein RGA1 [Curcuma longa]|uniref:putative disease resistance protein RGA1 n=1 Tax=Curcuma longa TaxID=136217 RepID=UPI003D9E7881
MRPDEDPIVAEMMKELKDAAYDAEDLLDEFAYQDLKEKIEGEGGDQASHFFSRAINTTTHLFNDAGARLSRVQAKLQDVADDMDKIMKLDDGRKDTGTRLRSRETSSFLPERVFGRDEDREKIIQMLLGSAEESASSVRDNNGFSIIPLVGIGGIGKTTLAQFVYNDDKLQHYFQLKIWVCVSGNFNAKTLTKEIIEAVTKREQSDQMKLDSLQKILKEKIASQRFLLVLDDVWDDNTEEWGKLLGPLKFGAPESKVIVTTRSMNVAATVGMAKATFVDGLEEAAYWELFKKCAFGSLNPQENSQLILMGKEIASKLRGSPLAAKTLGSLLRSDATEQHWRTIMQSEVWELEQDENGILPILRLSYQCLSGSLKQCFAFCSLFPKGYEFSDLTLIQLWMAEGFVLARGNKQIEDVGNSYFCELVHRLLFQKLEDENYYVMHDLIHDLAQLVSIGHTYRVEDKVETISSTVRHLSMFKEDVKTGNLLKFLGFNKLRTLILPRRYSFLTFLKPDELFQRLKSIRVLNLEGCGLQELPESVGNLIHLRYLDISNNSDIQRLPESLCGLYNLQTLILTWCYNIENLPQGMSRLINLRKIDAKDELIAGIEMIGKLTSLQQLPLFEVLTVDGYKVGELNGLRQLHGMLRITNLENVKTKEEAKKAELNNKRYLDALELEWANNQDCSLENELAMEVLNGLQPHGSLKNLTIKGHGGIRSPSWMKTEILSNLKKLKLEDMLAMKEFSWVDGKEFFPFLRELTLYNCPKLMRLPPLATSLVKLDLWQVGLVDPLAFWQGLHDQNGSSSMIASLELLEIVDCPYLKDLQLLVSHSLPSLTFLKIHRCQELTQLPLKAFKKFTLLEKMSIWNCPKLRLMQDEDRNLPLPSSIKELWLSNCGDLEKLLAGRIDNLISLTDLTVGYCPSLLSDLPSEAAQMTELGNLIVTYCVELKQNELGVQNSLAHAAFPIPAFPIPKLVLRGENLLSLYELEINSTALLKLLPLRNTLPTIKSLVISYSSQVSMFAGNEHELLLSMVALDSLRFDHCEKLQSLPTEMHSILSLENLTINNCPQIQSLPEKGVPASLKYINCTGCHLMLKKMVDKHNEQKIVGILLTR